MNLYQSKPKLYFDLKIKPNIDIFFVFVGVLCQYIITLGANNIGHSHAMYRKAFGLLYQKKLL